MSNLSESLMMSLDEALVIGWKRYDDYINSLAKVGLTPASTRNAARDNNTHTIRVFRHSSGRYLKLAFEERYTKRTAGTYAFRIVAWAVDQSPNIGRSYQISDMNQIEGNVTSIKSILDLANLSSDRSIRATAKSTTLFSVIPMKKTIEDVRDTFMATLRIAGYQYLESLEVSIAAMSSNELYVRLDIDSNDVREVVALLKPDFPSTASSEESAKLFYSFFKTTSRFTQNVYEHSKEQSVNMKSVLRSSLMDVGDKTVEETFPDGSTLYRYVVSGVLAGYFDTITNAKKIFLGRVAIALSSLPPGPVYSTNPIKIDRSNYLKTYSVSLVLSDGGQAHKDVLYSSGWRMAYSVIKAKSTDIKISSDSNDNLVATFNTKGDPTSLIERVSDCVKSSGASIISSSVT